MEKEQEQKLVVKRVAAIIEQKGLTPLYIAVVGSRAKGLESSTSDYDIKAMTIATHREYMLQQVKGSFHFSTEANGVEVEGTASDFLTVANYVLSTNMVAYDMYGGIRLYTTELAETLRGIWYEAYNPKMLHKSLLGLLQGYLFKKIGRTTRVTTSKLAMEAVYVSLKIRQMADSGQELPPYKIQELLEARARRGGGGDEKWMIELVQGRKAGQSSEYELTEEFKALTQEALALELKETEKSNIDLLREKTNQLFLRTFE